MTRIRTNDDRDDVALNLAGDPVFEAPPTTPEPPTVKSVVPSFPMQPISSTQNRGERLEVRPFRASTPSKGGKGSSKAGGKGAVGKTISRGSYSTPTTTVKPRKKKVGKRKIAKVSGFFLSGQKSGTWTKANPKRSRSKSSKGKTYRGK